jgi:hypothetical protein
VPIELAAALAGVSALAPAIEGILKSVDSIRRGWFSDGNNARVQAQLKLELEELTAKLASIGELGHAATAYLEALKEVDRLRVDVIVLQNFLDYSGDALNNHLSAAYTVAWRTADSLLDALDRDRSLPMKAHLNRQSWFDAADHQMIGSKLNDANRSYAILAERVADRRYDDVRARLDELASSLRDVAELLHSTLDGQILRGLQSVQMNPAGRATSGDAQGKSS